MFHRVVPGFGGAAGNADAIIPTFAARMTGFALPEESTTVQLIGSLTTGWWLCLSYWFGTTRGSAEKTALLAKAPAIDS